MAATGNAEERRSRLLEFIRLKGFASLPDLAGELGVSESTVRRDLDFHENAGNAKRTHGGVFYTGPSPNLVHFDQRQKAQWEKKKRIVIEAAKRIEDGDTILLDGGSTTYELARLLIGRPLQVVTNSLPVASLFLTSGMSDLVFIGGYVHTRTGVSLGPYANHMLADLNVRHAVLSVAGINAHGYYNSNLLLVGTEKAMMNAADDVMVVADSSKFGRSSLAHLCPLGDVDVVVVDDGIHQEWRQRLSDAGVTVVVAATEPEMPSSGEQADD